MLAIIILAYFLGIAAYELMEPPGIQWGWVIVVGLAMGVLSAVAERVR